MNRNNFTQDFGKICEGLWAAWVLEIDGVGAQSQSANIISGSTFATCASAACWSRERPEHLVGTTPEKIAAGFDFCSFKDSLELHYRFQEGDDEWTPVKERVWLARQPQPFGGERRYFLCPRCQRRCMVLYGGAYFRCRKCYGLVYSSQNADALDRLRYKAEKIRERLGGHEGIDWPFPVKPKGMHWRTYERLRAKCKGLEDAYERLLDWHLDRLSGVL